MIPSASNILGATILNVWNLRKFPKSNIDFGKCETGKVKPTAFPMSRARSRSYRLGSKWRWRVIKFQCEGCDYRVLLAYRTDREQFLANLGLFSSGDTKIVASLEFHGTHPGWHLHYAKDQIDRVPAGIRRGPWNARFNCHSHLDFGAVDSDFDKRAVTIVCDVFGIRSASASGGML